MPKFSERIGVVETLKILQLDSISDELRNSLWNLFHDIYEVREKQYWRKVAKHIAQYFRKVPVDELSPYNHACRGWVKECFYDLDWYELYDLTEFIVNNHVIMTREYYDFRGRYNYHPVSQTKLIEQTNLVLERELSGYRFISGVLSPISAQVEVDEIQTAIEAAKREGLYGVQEHLRTALELFGKKPEPDYRNAIKEAISAVESIVKQISGADSRGLDDALAELGKTTDLHAALKSGFKKLYGYSSDEDGIRHAILEQPNVGFPEAKYMIVSCSAFVNYLVAKADSVGLLS